MIVINDEMLPAETAKVVRDSAISGGFNTMIPPGGVLGQKKYGGMGFHGQMAIVHNAISRVIGRPIYPNLSFFRILTEDEDDRLIHSDRNDGSYTSIVYLSDHPVGSSGTAFYRHRETGLYEMPALVEMESIEQWDDDMHTPNRWEQTDCVSGKFGRILIFSAPLFHGRVPTKGIGRTPEDARMIHVSHFEI